MRSLLFAIRLLLLLLPVLVQAQVAKPGEAGDDPYRRVVEQGQKWLAEIERRLEQGLDLEDIDAAWKRVSDLRKDAKDCVTARTEQQQRIAKDLQLLGAPVEGEQASIGAARRTLEKDRTRADQELAACRLVLVKTETQISQLEQLRTQAQAAQLLARWPSLLALVRGAREDTQGWAGVLSVVRPGPLGFDVLSGEAWGLLVLVSVLALGLAALVWQGARRYVARHPNPADMTARTAVALVRALARYGVVLIPAVLWSLFWLVASWTEGARIPLAGISLAGVAFLLLMIGLRTFLAPLQPVQYFLPFERGAALQLARSLRFLGAFSVVAVTAYLVPLTEALPDVLVAVARTAMAALYVGALARFIWAFFSIRGKRRFGFGRGLFLIVLLAALGSEIGGYRNLSEYLLTALGATLAAVGIGWLISNLGGDFCDSLDEGRYDWERRLRELVGVAPGELLPGVFWLRLFVGGGTWVAVFLAMVRVWGVSPSERARFLGYLTEGFQVGNITIMPSRLVFALVLLALVMSAISWLKKELEERWLKKSRIDAGARNAVSTVTGYAGTALAILVTLAVAGVDLGNLAIIAGALSVGIGFGLQNIVNNFVSGLILLFERPIRKGDWIVVGATEGYVQEISIRSTQIRTFDRADVIVPNSELISSQVTNWMLRDLKGRVKVPVGVAYGSDVQKVKKLLLELAERHPEVILDGSVGRPWVLFLGFGDSALDFQVRFYVRNVDQRLSVLSDMNFAIERAFRENGIEIPFPAARPAPAQRLAGRRPRRRAGGPTGTGRRSGGLAIGRSARPAALGGCSALSRKTAIGTAKAQRRSRQICT